MLIECPYCNVTILVEALNCRIFRCGILKSNGTQSECERLYNAGLIYGCGKPFRVDICGNPVPCGYI